MYWSMAEESADGMRRRLMTIMFSIFQHFISSGAFKSKEAEQSEEIFKSVGIDKEGGLVFTLDTLQVKTHSS